VTVPVNNFLDTCLFFNTNAFSRHLAKLADGVFKSLNLSASHASLLLLVYETPGINPKELSRLLQLNPSTITRFIDALVKQKLVTREVRGKTARIHPTPKGLSIKSDVATAYRQLIMTYSDILGGESAAHLSQKIARANDRMRKALSSAQKIP
jgi:DNA-binding MarR family transcriptional regulator